MQFLTIKKKNKRKNKSCEIFAAFIDIQTKKILRLAAKYRIFVKNIKIVYNKK